MKLASIVATAALLIGTVLLVNTLRAQDAAATRQRMIDLGKGHKTAESLYQALKSEAHGGRRLTPSTAPDWSGVYTRARGGITFDPDQPRGGAPTARLTPEFQAKLARRIEDVNKGIEWDPISTCSPPGHPRWLTEPFLRDFVVTPDQTYLINEMMNDIRRIYTDGRDHGDPADRYPLYNGDSIGFWDGGKLVIHTNQLREGIYQRRNPDYTDQVETVEIWQKTTPKLIEVDVWVYDPPALVEPWYTKQSYAKLDDQGKSLRIRYWHCGENQNNAVVETEGGGTQFQDFTFDGRGSGNGNRTRRYKVTARGLMAIALLLISGTASAHHSATMFEQTKQITVEGVVKEFQYTNPHSWLLVDVKDKNGQVTTWGFEAEGPSTLQRAGIRPSVFPAGTKVTMTGRPMKDGTPAAIWVLAIKDDGKKYDPRAGFQVK